MLPDIRIFKEKILIGKRLTMSFSVNRTTELWKSFMPERKKISRITGPDLYSVEIYRPGFFDPFNPSAEFEKWAAVEVTGSEALPEGMEVLTVSGGMYAVFLHKGLASEAPATYGYIFGTWLPGSGFLLDDRPHFAVMGEKYRKDDPSSEEEIWIPVRPAYGR
jgi:AraC family transcriptional regulator